jgi:peptidoglycan/LPS O-acetylase OafA/YrhL
MLASVIFIAMTTKSIPWITVFRIRMIGISILIISGPLLLACRAWGTRFDNVVLSLISLVIIIWITAPFTLGSTPRLANFIDNRIFYRLGTISLSIYLWHYPVLLLTRRWGLYGDDSIPGMLESAAIVLIPCVILSEITYRLVEAPAQRWEIRRSPNKWPRLHR